jgi:riboflavin kinase/FMN adenylyltransferase
MEVTQMFSVVEDQMKVCTARVFRHSYQGELKQPVVCTLGKFDGLHLGHQLILERMHEVIAKGGGTSIAMILWPHPLTVLRGIQVPRIQSLREQIQLLSRYGVQNILLLRFSKELSLLSADDFIGTYLINMLQVSCLIVGEDAAVGYNREGNTDYLRRYLEPKGINFEVIKHEACNDGLKIGSGAVRSGIARGNPEELFRQLGRYYTVEGRVIQGDRRGSEIGFPTANLHVRNQLLPANGVYVTVAELNGVEWPSVTNVGVRPTVDGSRLSVETHILGFPKEPLYGRRLRVGFVKKIRDEKKFDNLGSLILQISKDVEKARAYFK